MQTTVSIPGIHCILCEALVRDASLSFPAIRSVDIDPQEKSVTIAHKKQFNLRMWSRAIQALNPAFRVVPLFRRRS